MKKKKNNQKVSPKTSKASILISFQYQPILAASFVINFSHRIIWVVRDLFRLSCPTPCSKQS